MNRYRGGSDNEFEPGSRQRVLKNLLGIHRVRSMDRAEFDALVLAQQSSYEAIGTETTFTSSLIRELHRSWLGQIYPFAGEFRTVDLVAPARKDAPEFRFAHAAHITHQMENFERDILRPNTPCQLESIDDLAHMLAHLHAEFIVIHPFREGNGRLGRWICDLIALQAGFPPFNHGFSGRKGPEQRRQYLAAMNLAFYGDYSALEQHFYESIERGLGSY